MDGCPGEIVLLSTKILKVVLWMEDESDRNIIIEQQESNRRKVLALQVFRSQKTSEHLSTVHKKSLCPQIFLLFQLHELF